MGKGAKWGLGIVALALTIVGIRLYQLYDKMVVISGISGVKWKSGSILIDTTTRIKNPTASTLRIKPPFVTVLVNGAIIASSNIPVNKSAIKIEAQAETPVPNQLELPLLNVPKLVSAKQQVEVRTFIRFGPFGAFHVTKSEFVTLNIPI